MKKFERVGKIKRQITEKGLGKNQEEIKEITWQKQ